MIAQAVLSETGIGVKKLGGPYNILKRIKQDIRNIVYSLAEPSFSVNKLGANRLCF